MNVYTCKGSIFIEGTGESANYDFDMEAHSEPNELEVLDYMIEQGIIQIIHESADLWEEE